MLTKRDLQYLQRPLSVDLLTHLAHEAGAGLFEKEARHLEYIKGLDDRLKAAIETAPSD